MNDKPTYQQLEDQLGAVKSQNKELLLKFSLQSEEKKKCADELNIAHIALSYESREKSKRAAELITANIELEYQSEEKKKRADELIIANIELEHQSDEKKKCAAELIFANIELELQGEERKKRAYELTVANIELEHQSDEKAKRAAELIIANIELEYQGEEKKKRADELRIANIELEYQNTEKKKRAAELIIANIELEHQVKEKKKRAEELRIANIELEYQSDEKKKRAAELIIANIELEHQSDEKGKRAAELIIANIELVFQNEQKAKRAAELIISKIKYAQQNEENEKLEEELTIANLAVGLQLELIVAKQKAEDNEIQLRELNATKDKLFSIVAHDLRSPLGGIISISEMMVNRDLDKEHPENLKEIFEEIHESSKSTFSLLENLLEWARIQTGSITFNPVAIQLNTLLKMAIEPAEINASNKNITISVNSEKDYSVFVDINMIATLIRNLLSNAVKFTNSNGAITISAKQDIAGNSLEIAIEDTGVGIPSNRIHDLFSIDKTTTTRGTENEKGTGLGLILSKEFVEKHKGTIWVESELGKGSVFKFTIPLNEDK